MNGTVTLSFTDWQAAQRTIVDHEATIARLTAALAAAEVTDPTGRVPALVAGLRAARVLVPLAMQAPALAWPYDALVTFADVLQAMPGATVDDEVTAIDMRAFASMRAAPAVSPARPPA